MTDCIVIKSDFDQFPDWESAFTEAGFRAVPWERRDQHADAIRYALVWKPGPGELAALPALELVFSVGAGVDHLVGDGLVPEHVPVVRNVEPGLTAGMVEYVVYHVIRFHRRMAALEADQRDRRWEPRLPTPPWEHTVGILGMGVLGTACGLALSDLGFRVAGWGRTPRELEGIECRHGPDSLPDFLGQSEFLVCLLPLTAETRGILCRETLAMLPGGACLINAGRGPLVVDADLLAALDDGHVGAAALDVFNQEPLPGDHPYWSHPAVTISPHIASVVHPASSTRHIVENIRRHRAGQPLVHVADLARGY